MHQAGDANTPQLPDNGAEGSPPSLARQDFMRTLGTHDRPETYVDTIREPPPQRMGRPRKYTAQLGKAICMMLATTTFNLRQCCEQNDVTVGDVMKWIARYPDFGDSYFRARDWQCELRADEIIDIADNSTNDWVDYETKSGRVIRQFDYEHSRRSELRIKARQWLMEKYARKRFGDRLEVQQTVTAVSVTAMAEPQRVEDAVSLLRRVRERLAAAEADGELIDVTPAGDGDDDSA